MPKSRKRSATLIYRPCCEAFVPQTLLYTGSVRLPHLRGCRRG